MKLIINNFYLMKINTTFLLILLVTRMSSVNLYFHHQDITPNATVGIFDFTEDLSVIAIGNSNNRYEILTHTDFTYVISGASAGGYEVDLTNDGAFMLVSKFQTSSYIFLQSSLGVYSLKHGMSLGGKSAGGSFLEDGSAIIVTGIDTASIITGSGGYYFTINQNFTGLGDYVTASKVTPDATTIAFASRIQFNVFTGSLGNYTQLQQVDLGSTPYDDVEMDMTEDGVYISVNYEVQALIYKLNSGTGQYALWVNITESASVMSASFNFDQSLFLVTTASQTHIYRIYSNASSELLQTLEISTATYSKMSKDKQFIFVGGVDLFKIYRHCSAFTGYVDDSENIGCDCDAANDYEEFTDGTCGFCSIDNCTQCQDNSTCAECDSGYELDGTDCVEESEESDSGPDSGSGNCSVEFCQTCSDSDSSVCEVCMDDYFQIDGECNSVTTAVIAGSVFGGVAVILIAAALVYVFVIKKTAATVGASTIIGPEQLSKGQIE